VCGKRNSDAVLVTVFPLISALPIPDRFYLADISFVGLDCRISEPREEARVRGTFQLKSAWEKTEFAFLSQRLELTFETRNMIAHLWMRMGKINNRLLI
jgi:hypothetical protein